MCKVLTVWRTNPSLKQLNAQSLQVTAKRAQLALQTDFRRAKNVEEPGCPRFKSGKSYASITFVVPLVPCFAGFTKAISGWELTSPTRAVQKLHLQPLRFGWSCL
jgi:hypothetical protein